MRKGDYYIIADHLRTIIFALADGAKIEQRGRGYILKKLLKRVCLISYFFGLTLDNLLLVSKKIIAVNNFYVHLKENEDSILSQIKEEIEKENNFIAKSTKKIDDYCAKNPQRMVASDIIFL